MPSGSVGSVPNQKNEFDNLYDKRVEKASIRERAFKREDTKEVRANIMMTQHEVENCTFEPAVGKQDPHWQYKKQYYPPDEENKTWVDKFGTNFHSSNPEVFKNGILKKAYMHYSGGRYSEAITTLAEGFNFVSIKQYYEQ